MKQLSFACLVTMAVMILLALGESWLGTDTLAFRYWCAAWGLAVLAALLTIIDRLKR